MRWGINTGEGQKGDSYNKRTPYGGKDISDGQQRKGGGMEIRGGGRGQSAEVKQAEEAPGVAFPDQES